MADEHATAEDRTVLRYLDPAEIRFEQTPGGVLRLHLSDRCHRRAAIYRVFPLTRADAWLSVRCGDDEVGVLRDLAELEPEQRQMVAEAVERRYFRPQIRGVQRIDDQAGQYTWSVETDRGPVTFATEHPRQSTTRLEDGRWLVTDVDNNRYEIADLQGLDVRSRSRLLMLLG